MRPGSLYQPDEVFHEGQVRPEFDPISVLACSERLSAPIIGRSSLYHDPGKAAIRIHFSPFPLFPLSPITLFDIRRSDSASGDSPASNIASATTPKKGKSHVARGKLPGMRVGCESPESTQGNFATFPPWQCGKQAGEDRSPRPRFLPDQRCCGRALGLVR